MKEEKPRHWRMYILKLEQDKWYVGITSKTVSKRYSEHVAGRGSNWTRKYKPIQIFYSKDLGICNIERAELFEGRVTRKYMEKYGDNNVRGGDLTATDEYVRRFGFFFTKWDWETITTVILLMLAIIAMVLEKYL